MSTVEDHERHGDRGDPDDRELAVPWAPVVAIDGPAGSGKSTIARLVADALGVPNVDTGALYRAAALACLRERVDLNDPVTCTKVVRASRVRRHDDRTFLDGEDVEDEIRGDEVTRAVSAVSAHPGVRDALVPAQRAAVAGHGGVVEGRDIGSVVLPQADLKVFLTASVAERARRRAHQLGRTDVDTLVRTIEERDRADAGREHAPLLKPDDAFELDSTGMPIDEVVATITAQIAEPTPFLSDPVEAHGRLRRVAIVGRPNVGKSTLVNRIVGRRVAIVEERPGVTRDRVEHRAEWAGHEFVVVDTGGWEHDASGLDAQVAERAIAAARDADVVVFVVDATVGALEDDERYARLLRRAGVEVVVAANKVDSESREHLVHELHGLGLGAPHPVSARLGRGVGDLLDVVVAMLGPVTDSVDASEVPRVAIVGRPNVGKSSLFNRLLGQDRSLVDDVPHTTRDAVDSMVRLDDRPWVFVDTAGMRRRYRHGASTELYSVDRTRDAVATADIALFVVDASEPLGEQDQRLAALLRDAGCGIVLVCNKWDEVDEDRRTQLERELDRLLSFAAWAPRVYVSAATGRGVLRLPGHLWRVWENYRRRVPTRQLNQIVDDAVAAHAPPRHGNRQLKLRYVTQAETRPPRFVLFTNGRLPDSYLRYLERTIRTHVDFEGVPLLFQDRPPEPRRRRR